MFAVLPILLILQWICEFKKSAQYGKYKCIHVLFQWKNQSLVFELNYKKCQFLQKVIIQKFLCIIIAIFLMLSDDLKFHDSKFASTKIDWPFNLEYSNAIDFHSHFKIHELPPVEIICQRVNVYPDDGPLISEEDRVNLPILVLNEFDFLFGLNNINNEIRHLPAELGHEERMIHLNRMVNEWLDRNIEDRPGFNIEEFGKC